MLILSIDIGMKHLAHCLLRVEDTMQIVDWDVVDLTECPKCQKCVKVAAYRTSHGAYCKKHLPVVNASLKSDMEEACKTHGIPVGSRTEMAAALAVFKKKETVKAKTTVELGRALAEAYARFPNVDVVLVENQMATRMAVVQGMVIQYWVMRGAPTIEVVSPTNKLKVLAAGKTTYAERKKLSIERTRALLDELKLTTAFETHKKKDDLADTFLQAVWYLKR
jgi:hypothetical protein